VRRRLRIPLVLVVDRQIFLGDLAQDAHSTRLPHPDGGPRIEIPRLGQYSGMSPERIVRYVRRIVA
jgi:hypothetical protein